MRSIILAAALAASPAAADPTCEQVGQIARIFAEAMREAIQPALEIGSAVTIDRLQNGNSELGDRVMPLATSIPGVLADHATQAMTVFAETGCAP